MARLKQPLLIVLASLAICAPTAHGDVWAERAALAAIASELSDLEVLVQAAARWSDSSNRTLFAYSRLLDDVRKIRAGISQHLDHPMEPVLPGRIDALSHEYTEHQP